VQVLRQGDVDDVHVVPRDRPPPIRLDVFPAPPVREGPYLGFVPPAGDLEDGLQRQVKEPGRLQPGVRVRLAHEFVADDRDANFLFHGVHRIPDPASGGAHSTRPVENRST
jgi:hypothetical protein